LIARLLDVIDNVERAFGSVGAASDPEGLKKGLELTFAQLKDILTKEGLCPIECVGTRFDPNLHEAVMAVEKEGAESENVVEEVQRGYTLKGKLLRPSKVVVAK
jgi:molecular chaperone GrpE